jgi:predicted enzyme related to lactoylglutathione lyase
LSFHSSLFGWQFEKAETEDYWMIKNAGISGAIAPRENPEQMLAVFLHSFCSFLTEAKGEN